MRYKIRKRQKNSYTYQTNDVIEEVIRLAHPDRKGIPAPTTHEGWKELLKRVRREAEDDPKP